MFSCRDITKDGVNRLRGFAASLISTPRSARRTGDGRHQ